MARLVFLVMPLYALLMDLKDGTCAILALVPSSLLRLLILLSSLDENSIIHDWCRLPEESRHLGYHRKGHTGNSRQRREQSKGEQTISQCLKHNRQLNAAPSPSDWRYNRRHENDRVVLI